MKIAIMQPYFLPHLGYFQLVNCVDKFIFYDNVNFIKGGWINRNKFRKDIYFRIPIKNQSQNNLIMNTEIMWDDKNINKFLKTMTHLYSSSLNFDSVSKIIKTIFKNRPKTIAELAIDSIIKISDYLGINTKFKISSKENYKVGNNSTHSIIIICKEERATNYINLSGGKDLYSSKEFEKANINLSFIDSKPGISILDYCFSKKREFVMNELRKFRLLNSSLVPF